MAKYRCTVGNYVYDEEEEEIKLPEDAETTTVIEDPKSLGVESVGILEETEPIDEAAEEEVEEETAEETQEESEE